MIGRIGTPGTDHSGSHAGGYRPFAASVLMPTIPYPWVAWCDFEGKFLETTCEEKNISDGYKMLQTKNIEEHCFLLSCPTESHASVPRCPVPSDRPSDQWPHWCFQFSQGPLHGKLATPGPVWILQVGGQGSHRNTGWWHAMHVYYIYILLYCYYIYICTFRYTYTYMIYVG